MNNRLAISAHNSVLQLWSRGAVWLLGFFLLLTAASVMALTPAGKTFGNQASAEYVDATGTLVRVDSNEVLTTVVQVGGVQMRQNLTLHASPGNTIFFPVAVQNTGNGDDSFTLSATNATGDAFDCANTPQFFADSNNDGQPDNLANPITNTGNLPANGTARLLVSCQIPSTNVVDGDTNDLLLTASSDFAAATPNPATDSVTDTAIVDDLAFNVRKSALPSSGAPGDTVIYTLIYENTGTQTTDIAIEDTLPANVTYVAGSGFWDAGGGDVPLSDVQGQEAGAAQNLVEYSVSGNVIDFIAFAVPANTAAEVNFEVTVSSSAPPGFIINQATFDDGTGANPGSGDGNNNGSTNEAPFEVLADAIPAAVSMSDPATGQPNADANPGDGAYTVASAAPGDIIELFNIITNESGKEDTFDITLDQVGTAGPDFPGTIRLLSSARIRLLDTDNSGTIDTGPVQPGASVTVIVEVTLDSNAPSGGPVDARKVATSANDPTVSANLIDRLSLITARAVDVTNEFPAGVTECDAGFDGCGFGPGPEAAGPVNTEIVTAGQSAYFRVYVNNLGSSADSYDLAFSDADPFVQNQLPAGWSVVFHLDNNGADDANDGIIDPDVTTVINTGSIASNGSAFIWAEVRIPAAGAGFTTPGIQDIYIRATSVNDSSISDIKRDAVNLQGSRILRIEPNRNGIVEAGNCIIYPHTITNLGLQTEANGTDSTLELNVVDGGLGLVPDESTADPNDTKLGVLAGAGDASQFAATRIYLDDGDGDFDAGDTEITSGSTTTFGGSGLAPQGSALLFLQVCALGSAPVDSNLLTELTGELENVPAGGYASANLAAPPPAVVRDSTTVVPGDRTIVKEQLLNELCQPSDADFQAQNYQSAQLAVGPGQCLCYRISVTNSSVNPITGLNIEDATPPFTTYNSCNGNVACEATANDGNGIMNGVVQAPTPGASGPVTADIGVLADGATASLRFCVQVDQ